MKNKNKIFVIFILIISSLIFCKSSFALEPNINAKAAISVEISTGKIVYEKNAYEKMFPASTTKVMTALLVLENCSLDEKETVSYEAIKAVPNGYSNANLQVGEEITVKDLLYALMLPSANEAANVLAEHVAGSVESFATMMNTRAEELGCKTTHFVNPNGIHNDGHYSTAYDLYLIAREAMKNDTFRKIVSTTKFSLPPTEVYPENNRTFTNTNKLIIYNNSNRADNYYYKNAIGIKTGFTSQAGNCLISCASQDGLEFINVVLNCELTEEGLSYRFLDSIDLFNYDYNNYEKITLKEKDSKIDEIEIKNATKATKKLDVNIKDSIIVLKNKDILAEDIKPEIVYEEKILAPILKGQVIGTIKYNVDEIEYTSELIAGSDVEHSMISIYLIIIGGILLVFSIVIMPKNKKNKYKLK
ncbi:MAG: D-alanyl-D-alanine carboxypeptidase [Clostridia bacterium]|nr:D-alanyl-D-alanine carboxypeptidase [Clostridia bacterium]